MKIEKGTLKKTKKGFEVVLPTKKGTAPFQIPHKSSHFRPEDGADGVEVEVERDDKNNIVRVTIPGKPVFSPQDEQPAGMGGHRSVTSRQAAARTGRPAGMHRNRPPRPETRHQAPSGESRRLRLGSSVCRSITRTHSCHFRRLVQTAGRPRPFPWMNCPRSRQRLTGVLELDVTTESPLLTCHPQPLSESGGHKTYGVLTIGLDVIVPATGIRGFADPVDGVNWRHAGIPEPARVLVPGAGRESRPTGPQ